MPDHRDMGSPSQAALSVNAPRTATRAGAAEPGSRRMRRLEARGSFRLEWRGKRDTKAGNVLQGRSFQEAKTTGESVR